jgi:hypothetical protein
VKIAAFVVVNASGSVIDRGGNIVSCHPAASWGGLPKIRSCFALLFGQTLICARMIAAIGVTGAYSRAQVGDG